MRLLYVIDSLAPGGAETSLVEMAPWLVSAGLELHVLPLGCRLDLAPVLEEAGATVHRRTKRTGRIENVQAVLKTARAIQPDLIHTTLYEADIAGRIAARLLHIPASTSIVSDSYSPSHYTESNKSKLDAARAVDAFTARFATRIHANSSAIASSVPPRLALNPQIVDVIPRGRDPQRFPYRPSDTRSSTRTQLDIPPDVKMILAVGRLEPAKGLHHLLAAVPSIAARAPDAILVIAGRDGRAADQLRSAAQDLSLEVRFLGHRTDVPALLAAADVLAFPSEREGSPGALIEAMAVGTPIVASDIPPCLEVLGGATPATALVVPVGDQVALAAALLSALDNQDASLKRSRAGRTRFEQLYSIGSVTQSMLRFFNAAADRSDSFA